MVEGNEPGVIATCPVCKKEFRADKKERLLLTSYMVAVGQNRNQIQMQISLPKIVCTGCGVEFLGRDALEFLRKKARGEASSNIIMPGSRVKLN